MLSHGPQDIAIELPDGKQPPWGPMYNLSEKELLTLCSNFKVQLKRGWISLSKSPAGAPDFFMPKRDGTLWQCVDLQGVNQFTKKK
jgi:hypothetical protein